MRLVCGIKYGTDDLRCLKAADKAAVHLGVGYAPGMRGISIDFSGAANAALQSAKDTTSRRQSKGRMASLFDWLRGANGTPAETWKGVALQIGLAAVDKCTPGQITATLMLAALLGFNAITDTGKHRDTLEHAFKISPGGQPTAAAVGGGGQEHDHRRERPGSEVGRQGGKGVGARRRRGGGAG